ncbi:aminomethyl-transferring glycine dehydrogenase [Sporichthya polymorpha]|uniref:aminomethyl-transferring glycine dehydrogenase n=1 Tax=Sporichthya polymorpha TaxID=35751 RepID=UPI000380BDEE|nr:aminomethyl-transferring glycine dehydrogenase [Sporichthya polymorpha]
MLGPFVARHVGPSDAEQATMLAALGYDSLTALATAAVPDSIRLPFEDGAPLAVPPALSEDEVLAEIRALSSRNTVRQQMIGLGYYETATPGVILRKVLENPGWYTAYTPYQPEISQGRLEVLLAFQTVVSDLMGLAIANASLLDEGTAVAEAVTLMRRSVRGMPDARVVLDADCLPQTVEVVRTRCEALGIDVEVADLTAGIPDGDVFGVVVQYPGASGRLRPRADYAALADAAHSRGAMVTAAADLLACTLIEAPGSWGVDIAVGSAQRFGVPLGFGGPHAGFVAVRAGLERALPGRLVGQSVDSAGRPAYRLALQTREQHIRREKATSNICTAQVLLAVIAALYAIYHGPEGLTAIARQVHGRAKAIADGLRHAGIRLVHDHFFDTLLVSVPGRASTVVANARRADINLGLDGPDRVRIACGETTTFAHVAAVLAAFGAVPVTGDDVTVGDLYPEDLGRTTEFLTAPVFHSHRSETAMLRYVRKLANKDYALDRGMIPLGSCTMKLNATTEMEPITWPRFGAIHPFAPAEDWPGYLTLIRDLEYWLAELTGYDRVSLQPNAGSQGELAGLLAIRAFHKANGHAERDVCLIPASAHGTNAASAVMAGMRVVVVAANNAGEVDLDDLRAKIGDHRERLAVIMVTYPSTHGVFEDGIRELCDLVHSAGGQVYIDGANFNALLGLAKPGEFGGDVSHLNLHKTFCIPHGGGGPGVGPVAVKSHLAPYLPNHPLVAEAGPATGVGPISAAPFGSAGILPIPWAYIRLMGPDGLLRATQVAILAANYVAARLGKHFPVLYTGRNGLVAHECILDLRPITKATGVTVDDVAKRLIDYGFHAPTVSFPVAGTLMVEPTESEDLGELDRFCDAMIAIAGEIDRVAAGEWPADDNPLRNAPHTADVLATAEWTRPYSREEAVFPNPAVRADKYWPPVGRIDGAYGDRNLVCSCPSVEELAAE